MTQDVAPQANDILKDMIASTEGLITALDEETRLLQERNMDAFMSFQAQKADAGRSFERSLMATLKARKEMDEADPALKEALHALENDFEETKQKNLHALEAMSKGTRRVEERIMSSIRKHMKGEQIAYSGNGSLGREDTKSVSMGVETTA